MREVKLRTGEEPIEKVNLVLAGPYCNVGRHHNEDDADFDVFIS